jgi:replicative DNA helicase
MATEPRSKKRPRDGGGGPSVTDRLPPQDADAEMALLGSMMMSRDAITDVIPIIGREASAWLYRPDHQRLFEVLLDLYDQPGKAIDLVVVRDELRRRALLEEVGGEDYMIQLAESFGDWANAEHYARIVRDKGMLRDLIKACSAINDEAYAGAEDARAILDAAEKRIFEVTSRRVSGQSEPLAIILKRLSQMLGDTDTGITGMPSGLHHLDEMTGGFQKGDLIILAARPSMGKTALGLNMAQHAAFVEQRPVLFLSMEMSADQVAQRLLCSHSQIDGQKIRRRMLSEDDLAQLFHACSEMEHAPLYIDDTPGMTAMEVRAVVRRAYQKHGIEAVYLDYLQLMHWPGAESRQVEISSISRSLKSLARELKIPIIAMAQLNRMPEGRADKRPMMSDLRESGAIEQDADVIMLIHREEYYRPEDESLRGLADLIVAKQRNGPVGSVELTFNKKLSHFKQRYLGPEPVGVGGSGGSGMPF